MANRHQRRKAALAKAETKLLGLAQAQRSANVAAIVRKNMANPPERNYYPSGNMGRLAELSHRGYVCHNKLRLSK